MKMEKKSEEQKPPRSSQVRTVADLKRIIAECPNDLPVVGFSGDDAKGNCSVYVNDARYPTLHIRL